MNYIEVLTMIFGSLGGLELIKFLFTRKSNAKKAEAAAKKEEAVAEEAAAQVEAAEAAAEDAQLATLRRHIDWLQGQLSEMEVRLAEQTTLVRTLQSEVLDLTRKVTLLETERSMKLCERRGCKDRQPQSGY